MLCVCVYDREIENERRAIVEVDVVMLLRPSGFYRSRAHNFTKHTKHIHVHSSENDYPTLSNE